MLQSTFVHLPGLGKIGREKLAVAGIRCWDYALAAEKLPLNDQNAFVAGVRESLHRLEQGDAIGFRCFNVPVDMAHLDLLPVFRALGLKGGLKRVENQLGLERGVLDGVDGYTAILLWLEFTCAQQESALETLLAYNAEDVLSLEFLTHHA